MKFTYSITGVSYNELECIGYFERIVNFLGWKEFSFLGHSMGGNLGCLYAAVFPEKIKVTLKWYMIFFKKGYLK